MVSLLAMPAYFVKKLTLVDLEYTRAAVKGQDANDVKGSWQEMVP